MTSLAVVFDLIGRDGASPAFNRAAASADRLAAANTRVAGSFERTTAGMAALGSKLTKGLTVPLLGIAGVSVKLATDFNSAMTRVQTQAGASAKDVKTLSAQVLALSKTAQQGPVDLANALYHLKSVGLDNVQAMKALKTSSDLAAVGNANLEDTTNALAGAWRTGIRGAKNFHDAAATVNAVIGAGNMTLADFNDALGTGILASAKTFGLTLKDVGSALALFTDEGVPANAAATRLRMSFSLLGAPSNVAIKQLASVGISQFQLGNDLRKPNGLITAIGDLKQHLDDSGLSLTKQAALLSHAFGGGRSSSAILSLINNFSVLKQKQDQVTSSLGKYDKAVAAQKATPAAQFHELVANLEQAAIKLGNELLPEVTSLAHVLTGVVGGFNNMSASTKHFLVVAGGIALLSGPVLSLGTRLIGLGRAMSTVTVGMSAMVTRVSGASFTMSNRINTAVRGLTSALAGAAIGSAIGSFTQNASTGAKAAGALASAAAGAAIGFGAGGPLGAAIGGATGLLSSLVTAFNHSTAAADAASAAEQTYTESVKKSLDALSKVNTQQTAANLTNSKAYMALDELHTLGANLGLTYNDLTKAVDGTDKQFGSLMSQLHSGNPVLTAVYNNLKATLQAQRDGLHGAIAAQKEYIAAQHQAKWAAGDFANKTTVAGKAAAMLGDESNGSARPMLKLGQTTRNTADDTNKLSGAMHSAWLQGKALSKALEELGGKQLTTAQAEIQMQQGLEQLRQSWKKNGDAIAGNSTAQVNNRSLILQQIQNVKDYAATLDHGKDAAKNVSAALNDGIATIKANAIALGANKKQVDAYIRSVHLTPHDIYTQFHTDTANAKHALIEMQRFLQNLVNHNWTVHVGLTGPGAGSVHVTGNNPSGGISGGSFARGGTVGNGWFTSGEQGWELGRKVGNQTQFWSHADSMRITGLPSKLPGYANGTDPKHFKVGGTVYESRHAALNAAHRLLRQAIELDVHIKDHDLKKFSNSLNGTVDQARSAFEALFGDARKAGVFQRYPNLDELLKRQNHTLDQAIRERTKLSAQLKAVQSKMKAIVSSTSSAAAGAFDITSAGANPATGRVTGKGLEAQQRQAVAEIREWAHDLDKLRHRGLNGTYLQQLAGAGPSSLPQLKALLSLNSLKLVNREQRIIARVGRREGRRVANRIYGERERTLAADKRDEKQFIKSLGHEMAHELKHAIETVKEHETIVVKVDGKDLLSVTRKHARKGKRRDGNRPHTP